MLAFQFANTRNNRKQHSTNTLNTPEKNMHMMQLLAHVSYVSCVTELLPMTTLQNEDRNTFWSRQKASQKPYVPSCLEIFLRGFGISVERIKKWMGTPPE